MLGKKAKYGILPPSIGGENANYITRMMEKMPDELASDDRVVDPQLKRLFDNLQGGIPHIDLSMQMLPNSPSLFPDTSINNQRPTNASQLGQIILQEPYTSNSMGLVASDGKRSVTGSKSSNFSQNGDSLPAGYEYGSPVYHSPFNSSQDQGLNHQTSNQNQIQSNFVHPATKSRVSIDDNHPLTHSRTSLVDPNSMQSHFGARYSTRTNGAGTLGYADLQALNQQASPSLSVGAGSYMGVPRSDSIPQQLQHPQSRGQGSQASLELGGFSRDSSVPDLKNSVSPVAKGSGVAHTTSDVKPTVTGRKSSKSLDGKTARQSAQGDGDGDGSVKEEQYRTESHKASEQRSRTRLKDSINELATTVPTLVNVKNPSKAHIIKKATEFVHDTQKTNVELRLEHEKLKSELAALHLKHMKSMNTMNMGNIITVEILSKDFTYIFVDHMWEVFLGYSRSEVLGKTFKDISSCRNCELMLKRSMEIHETMRKKQVWRGLILSKRKDGQAFCCDTTITPVLDDSGDILQFVVNRKKFHILNGVDCQNICRGIMPEPKLTDEDEDNPSTAKLMIEEAIFATEKA
ncbi:hypothetical protein, variant [Sphaeroforma arctica JP610]|uniref:BHLH domain-containing protein n=1 Tax=Sphaeroforma arctica JP610 TaxID=667725 RepID=A0A0L0GEV0_9EUKA|nr:hypothetical protein, variant [Sphaeroforma arctica JP610]KNC87396.1 hypothetical protein, variant [Sphaeroforma arctica JP610]|eukprot:XP_014161298.1 hypothetical protein, variant [Sphaeroforma arctica JP610]